jgi:hypothetical protein
MNTELVPHTAADFLSSLKKLKCVLQQQMLPFPSLSFPFLSFASFIACVGGFRQLKLATLESTNSPATSQIL